MLVRRVTRSWIGLLGALFTLSTAPQTRASGAPREIAARFSAPPGCGDRTVLEQRFEDRVPELQMRFTDDAPVKFTIERSADVVRAKLFILLEEGGELSRTIEADDCEAAVETIAFVAAVALDPGAVDPLQIRTQERLLPETAVTRKTDPPPSPPPRAAPPSGRSWTAGLSGRAQLGAAPNFLWGGGVSLENSPNRGGYWAPSARLAFHYVTRGDFEEELGTARFQLVVAGLDLCPGQARGEIFRVQLCGTFQAGILLAEGRDTFAPTHRERPWLGLGPAISSEIRLAGALGLSYRGAAVFPLIRDTFRFQDAIFHEVPGVALELDAGLSVRF
jgi:hypothetical protein